MYLHQIFLDNKAFNGDHKDDLDIYTLHQKIWGIVSKSKHQKRDFLYRVEFDAYQNIKFVYLLAPYQVKPQENYKIMVSPKFRPQVETGESLYFKLRANPIVKKKENGRAKECDIIMDAKHKFKRRGQSYLGMFSMDELIHNEGINWLSKKGTHHGFSVKIINVKIDNYRRYSIRAVGKQSFTLGTLDFEGKLKITDADCFKKTLFRGIGSAKAFGCGLILVRRM
jgi:CRISPR system Cascade subunit CasE